MKAIRLVLGFTFGLFISLKANYRAPVQEIVWTNY